MLDLLEHDPRPTFLLDGIKSFNSCDISTSLAYWNQALASVNGGQVLRSIKSENVTVITEERRPLRSEFQTWIVTEGETAKSCTCFGYRWTKFLLTSQWIVVYGAPTETLELKVKAKSNNAILTNSILQSSIATFNWTGRLSGARMSLHSLRLRSIANIVMQDLQLAVVFYSSDLTMVYNKSYVKFLRNLHPCIGLSARVALGTLWSKYYKPIIVRNLNSKTVEQTDLAIHLAREDIKEEMYINLKFIPILDADGAAVGHYVPLTETISTKEVISRRQSQTLLQLSEEAPRARDINLYWALATEVFSRNNKDMLFILLYSVKYGLNNLNFSATRMLGEHQQCMLQGSKDYSFTPYFRQAIAAREPITVSFNKDLAAAKLLSVICLLNPTSLKDNILGFMVVGLNPCRPYNSNYSHFISIVSCMLLTLLTSILLHKDNIRRRESAIANVEKEVQQSVHKIFILGLNSVYSYRNKAWYSILGTNDRSLELDVAWDILVDDEYIPIGKAKFQALIDTKQHQSFEARLKRTSIQSLGDSQPHEQPVQQKLGEQVQAAHALNAQESKRQLESFIDTTSHEMRNPLSAIVQCADSIISTHKALGSVTNHHRINQSISESTIDAAEIIVQCSKHMKTIVDDVLTMSKLDSGLFVMTPVDVQLESVARDAVKMFESEARAAGVVLELRFEDSCKKLNVKTVSLDPTRVLQILINLLTNAIKFTRLEEKRHITVILGIAHERPLQHAQDHVEFIRTSEATEALSLQTDWDKGGNVYVIFAVQDTGRGLSDPERDLLFARFSQASPRTHIDYGGSGLGLFISRRLTEMHGGAIGFASKAGVGSTFAFYVRSRDATVSQQQEECSNDAVDLSIRTQESFLSSQSRNDGDQSPAQLVNTEVAASDLYVLIVEDNIVNQRVLAKQLRNVGINVAVANHGGEALDHLRTTTYCITDEPRADRLSLILMDWEMPVMDGLTCVRRIRELQQQGVVHGHVPVIAVTANVRSEQVEIAMKAGMDNVISKPFRIPELLACIQKTLRAML
ncbi:hypothetical protein P153DRAFT_376440 [Dothidotthia symphoricarpi CBS 119687]|uniref:Uncharacterized protein n=1 Tax=Dothidotthia symphoricarpi CBS 119687 TaxID=1392245 RepID=A0A6A6AC63_9PLEO|nr:uncharacterized protein P153DRAFT_376440 [Dothidotthia symphoricarpi CBS 119687]KAF2129176.1 hypothetical protein P153DRAFT_376440 [Dothidotthia symphoricarpi CBS 119687]